MRSRKLTFFVTPWIYLLLEQVNALIDPITVGGTVAVIAALGGVGYNFQCKYFECCNEDYIPLDTDGKKQRFPLMVKL